MRKALLPKPERVKAIKKYEIRGHINGLSQFLGFIKFYRKFKPKAD